jgi:hypothetical protein
MRSGSCVNQQTTQCAYQEDTSKKDQGQTLLDGGSAPPEPDEDGPATMAATTLAVGEDSGTCKAPSKWSITVTTATTLIPCRSGDTSVR